MQDEVSAATAMLGLDGFVLLAVSQHDGELEQAVETTSREGYCRGCGVQARLHDRRPTYVRDLPAVGRPVTLVWVKRVWRCREPRCPVMTWSETSPAIRARASLTERARVEACRRVGQDGLSVAQVAAAFGVAWGTVMAAVVDYGTPLVELPPGSNGWDTIKPHRLARSATRSGSAANHSCWSAELLRVSPTRRLAGTRNGEPADGGSADEADARMRLTVMGPSEDSQRARPVGRRAWATTPDPSSSSSFSTCRTVQPVWGHSRSRTEPAFNEGYSTQNSLPSGSAITTRRAPSYWTLAPRPINR